MARVPGAVLVRQREAGPRRWRLEFYDPFTEDGEEYPVRLTVRERDLKRSAGGRKMLRVMSEAREARTYAVACFLGVLDRGYGPEGETEIVGVPESVAAVAAVHVGDSVG